MRISMKNSKTGVRESLVPQPGLLVIRYSYLWNREALRREGKRREMKKIRPCAVVVPSG